jgi:hypothetical protein
MPNNNQKNIIFILTRDHVLACARELGIAKERVTDEALDLIKDKINREFGRWPEIVKEILTQAAQCPLGLTCFPSCCWWKEGRCIFPQ